MSYKIQKYVKSTKLISSFHMTDLSYWTQTFCLMKTPPWLRVEDLVVGW